MPYGNFYYGSNGFFFKKNGGGGTSRVLSLGAICNQPQDINNRYVSGSGVGASSTAQRRAKIMRAATCYPFCPQPIIPTVVNTDSEVNPCNLLPTNTPYQVCSPQPQFGGIYNNQQRRTPIVASKNGTIAEGNQATSNLVTSSTSSPIIAADGTIYIGYTQFTTNFTNPINGYFTAYNPNRTVKWSLQLDSGDINGGSSSAIGKNGTNYFVTNNDTTNSSQLYAITSTGVKSWKTELADCICTGSSVIISVNEEIFVCGYNVAGQTKIYAVNNLGTIIAGYPLVISSSVYPNSKLLNGPALSNNGILYLCAFNDSGSNDSILYAVDTITKTKKWEYNVSQGVPQSCPALSSDEETVYFTFDDNFSGTPGYLYAINTVDGTLKWRFATPIHQSLYDTFSLNSLALGKDGTVFILVNGYINDTNPNNYGKLIAVTKNGNEKWRYTFGNISATTGSYVNTTPIIDGDERIYVGVQVYDGSNPSVPTNIQLTMFSITTYGQLKWSRITSANNTSGGDNYSIYATSPAIGLDGTIYIGSTYSTTSTNTSYSRLYAIV
jgi:hypothetical protein